MVGLQERAKLMEYLAALPSQRASANEEQSLATEIAGLEKDILFKDTDLKAMGEWPCPFPAACRSCRRTLAGASVAFCCESIFSVPVSVCKIGPSI